MIPVSIYYYFTAVICYFFFLNGVISIMYGNKRFILMPIIVSALLILYNACVNENYFFYWGYGSLEGATCVYIIMLLSLFIKKEGKSAYSQMSSYNAYSKINLIDKTVTAISYVSLSILFIILLSFIIKGGSPEVELILIIIGEIYSLIQILIGRRIGVYLLIFFIGICILFDYIRMPILGIPLTLIQTLNMILH